jgi:uncharacterized protein YqgV (UPF0045/DUF77 family)
LKFTFPEILTNRTREQQAQKVVDEVNEYFNENEVELSDKEAVDVLHAAETFIRVHFKGRMGILKKIIEATIKKNTDRGYYTKECF